MSFNEMTNEALLDLAMSSTSSEASAEALAVLEDRLRYGDEPEEYTVPKVVYQTEVWLECGTCAFVTERGGMDDRDVEHLRHDGAHHPGWYAEDDAAIRGTRRIRTDLELIRLIVERRRRSRA